MSQKYLVIADDFTGSNDTGVQMRKRGIPVDVILFPEEKADFDHSIVLDTESRNMTAAESTKKVTDKVSRVLAENEYGLVYKKIDSTLRGNIASEIQAIQEIYQADKIVFAPAFPRIGRTTDNAVHMLQGVPLMETEVAKDPAKPIETDNIIDLLLPMGEVRHHRLEAIRKGEIPMEGARLHTFDATTSNDLSLIAKSVLKEPGKVLWVGSAGLADAIFDTIYFMKPTLGVVASISEVSLGQMDYAQEQGTEIVQVGIHDMLQDEGAELIVERLVRTIEEGRDVILTATKTRKDYEDTIRIAKDTYHIDAIEVPKLNQRYLSKIVKMTLERTEVSGLFLTGGDTSIAIMQALGASGASIQREVLTAIVLSTVTGGPYDGMPIITKAGAFGKREDLYYCMDKIKESIQ